MITQAEAFAKAASWPVKAVAGIELGAGVAGAGETRRLDDPDIFLMCRNCDRSMGQLRRASTVYNGSLDEMLSMVLRHMVMAHDVPLNTRGQEAGGGG